MSTTIALDYLVQQSHPDWIGLSADLLELGRRSRHGQRFLAHRCKATFGRNGGSSSRDNASLRSETDQNSFNLILKVSAKQWHRLAIEIGAHRYAPIIKQTIAREEVQWLKSVLDEPLYREVLSSPGKLIICSEPIALDRAVQSLTQEHFLSHGAALILAHLKEQDEFSSGYVACTFPRSQVDTSNCRIDRTQFETRLQHLIQITKKSGEQS